MVILDKSNGIGCITLAVIAVLPKLDGSIVTVDDVNNAPVIVVPGARLLPVQIDSDEPSKIHTSPVSLSVTGYEPAEALVPALVIIRAYGIPISSVS
jgi:hypothetical protein